MVPAPGKAPRMRWGIRARVTTLTALVVALTLVLSAIALAALVRQSLVAGLDDALISRAESVAAQARTATSSDIPATPRQDSLVQVLDANGTVIASTANIKGDDPVLSAPPAARRTTVSTLNDSPLDSTASFRVVAYPVELASGPGWVYAVASTTTVEAATASLVTLFWLGLPLILIVVAITVWYAVTSALRPVERIRRRAAAIEASDLSQRLPMPPTHDEIAALTSTMNEMLDRLETASDRQRQFIGDASHELRSPLAGLRAQVEVALQHPEKTDLEHTLTTVRDEVGRMTTLTEDLLFLAQSTESSPMTLPAPVDLDDLVLDEVRRLRRLGGRDVSAHTQAARVEGSARDLSRLLRNLADNAYEHAHNAVAVDLHTVDGIAELTITDDGPGIAAELRETVFQRFARLDTSRRRRTTGGGFGLGLAIARQVALAHGGTLTAHERADGRTGAQFLLRIPLSERDATDAPHHPARP